MPPDGDHNNNGIPNHMDPDADLDGDGLPNKYDPDWKNPQAPIDPNGGATSGDIRHLGQKVDGVTAAIKQAAKDLGTAIGKIPGGGGGQTPGEPGEGEEPITRDYGPLKTVITDVSDKVEEAETEYANKLQQIRSEVSQMFSLNLNSGGSMPERITHIYAVDVNYALPKFLPEMSAIPAIILFVAAFFSALILFGGRNT